MWLEKAGRKREKAKKPNVYRKGKLSSDEEDATQLGGAGFIQYRRGPGGQCGI